MYLLCLSIYCNCKNAYIDKVRCMRHDVVRHLTKGDVNSVKCAMTEERKKLVDLLQRDKPGKLF